MANLNDIFGWFSIGKTPTAEQFKQSWSSFWHKSERLPQTQVLGLNDALNSKASKDDLASVTAGLIPMGNVENIAELNTKPKRNNDSYYVNDQTDEKGNPYIYRYDAELAQWINTKQVVYKDVVRKEDLTQIERDLMSTNNILKGDNSYYVNLGGGQVGDPNYHTSDFIDVIPDREITYMGNGHYLVASLSFYDENKIFLSGTNFGATTANVFQYETMQIPPNAKFIRASYNKSYDCFVTVVGYYANELNQAKQLAITTGNSISDYRYELYDPSEPTKGKGGLSSYRNFGLVQWNKPCGFFLLKLADAYLDKALCIVKLSVFSYENNTVNNILIAFYNTSVGIERCSSLNDSEFISKIEYIKNGKSLLLTFSKQTFHAVITVEDIWSSNRFGNITDIKTSYLTEKPTDEGEWTVTIENSRITSLVSQMSNIQSEIDDLQNATFKTDIWSQVNLKGYIGKDGAIANSSDTNWVRSDFISFGENQLVDIKTLGHPSINSISFYDRNQVFISGDGATVEGLYRKTVTSPKGTKYMKLSGGSSSYSASAPYLPFYAKVYFSLIEEVNNLNDRVNEIAGKKQPYGKITPYSVYTVCNDVVANLKGRNRNYAQAVYLDHFFNGFTDEKNIRIRNNSDRVVFNAPMTVTNSNEASPSVQYNGGVNVLEQQQIFDIIGSDIADTNFKVLHRSTLNSVTKTAHPKVLCIGDSITYGEQALIPDDNFTQNHVYHLICKELFMKDAIDNGNTGYDITFLGIYQKSKTMQYNGQSYDVVTHHEGIRGISMAGHLNGQVAQFKDDVTGQWSLKAWLNKYRTLDDDGNRLTLGNGTGTLITTSNINTIDVCTPTHVVIMLGANGGGTLAQWQQMIGIIKSEFPDMIVGVTLPDAAGTYFPSLHPNCDANCTIWNDTGSQGSRHNQMYNLQNTLQTYYATADRESANEYMLPFYFVAPTAESIALRRVNLPDADVDLMHNNQYFNSYGWHASTHVNGIGQMNWGYCLYSWLKYTIAKGIT